MVKPLTKPLQDCIDELIIKLEKRDLATYAATSGKMSTHYYGRVAVGTKSYEQSKKLPFLIKNNKFPALVKKGKEEKYFDAVNKYKGTGTSLDVADWVIPTFNKAIVKKTINGPTTLYRVIDPASGPDGFHWVTKEVFQKLKNRDEWRDKLAVKVDWNANGQYVTMDIPKGQKIEVWSGTAASQKYDDATGLYYPGGAEQIVFNPRNSGFKISERKETPWGYVDNDENLLNNRVIINVDGSTPRK